MTVNACHPVAVLQKTSTNSSAGISVVDEVCLTITVHIENRVSRLCEVPPNRASALRLVENPGPAFVEPILVPMRIPKGNRVEFSRRHNLVQITITVYVGENRPIWRTVFRHDMTGRSHLGNFSEAFIQGIAPIAATHLNSGRTPKQSRRDHPYRGPRVECPRISPENLTWGIDLEAYTYRWCLHSRRTRLRSSRTLAALSSA